MSSKIKQNCSLASTKLSSVSPAACISMLFSVASIASCSLDSLRQADPIKHLEFKCTKSADISHWICTLALPTRHRQLASSQVCKRLVEFVTSLGQAANSGPYLQLFSQPVVRRIGVPFSRLPHELALR